MNAVLPLVATVRDTSVINLCLQKPFNSPNDYDACLVNDHWMYDYIVMSGGLRKVCCPRGRKQYTQRPWVSMPAEGRRFKPIATLPVPAAPFTGLDTTVLSVTVPIGYDGVITDFVCGIDPGVSGGTGFIEGSGDLVWRLKANGRHLRDLGNIQTSLGSLTAPNPVPRGGIRVWSQDILVFSVSFAVGADARISPDARIITSITGWFYPR
jgi:hypothetical protein